MNHDIIHNTSHKKDAHTSGYQIAGNQGNPLALTKTDKIILWIEEDYKMLSYYGDKGDIRTSIEW